MHPQIIERYELVVAGIEATTRNASLAGDMAALGDRGEQIGLTRSIRHRADNNRALALVWDWSPEQDFPLMCGYAITSTRDQPELCTVRRFPRCDYAVFPMEGAVPNLVEPWNEIQRWYPLDTAGFTMTVRRYHEVNGTGEIWVPLVPNLRP